MTKNTKYSFAIATKYAITETTVRVYVEEFLNECRKRGLTISGEDLPLVRRGIDHVRKGHLMTVGTSGNHDIDWIERTGFACERNIKPIYDLVDDWNTIKTKLVDFVESKAIRTLRGTKVTFHAGFVRFGNEIIANEDFAKIVARLKY